jgi:uncharacterized SAM-binding protein YcdF (DUF218 family)
VIASAIVLLGCRNGSSAALRRSATAARAWHERVGQFVLVSGGRRWSGLAEAEALTRQLEALGVEPSAIVPELCSLSTRENAYYSARILRARGATQAAIVTCDWHLPRAIHCFRAAGVDAFGIAAISPPRAFLSRWRRYVVERVGGWFDRAAMHGARELR